MQLGEGSLFQSSLRLFYAHPSSSDAQTCADTVFITECIRKGATDDMKVKGYKTKLNTFSKIFLYETFSAVYANTVLKLISPK